MLPIAPDRGKRILEFLDKNYPETRGADMPYPGPVLGIADALAYLDIDNALITREDLERVHCKKYIDSLYDRQTNSLEQELLKTYELIDAQGRLHRYEPERALLQTYELIDAKNQPHHFEPDQIQKPLTGLFNTITAQVGGTWLACCLAMANESGFCYYLGGGMHHARYDSGSGFCLINDIAIAALKILVETANSEKPIHLIWIIDLDAHKGDGTAELILFERKRGELQIPHVSAMEDKPCVLTLSIHMARGWPLDAESLAAAEKDRAPLLPSDIDIGIDSGEEEEYTPRLAKGIEELERLSSGITPDLALVVDGVDPYEHDELPSSSPLKLTLEQCIERDNYVYRYLMDRKIPSAWLKSGGYGSRAWEPTAHFLQGIR